MYLCLSRNFQITNDVSEMRFLRNRTAVLYHYNSIANDRERSNNGFAKRSICLCKMSEFFPSSSCKAFFKVCMLKYCIIFFSDSNLGIREVFELFSPSILKQCGICAWGHYLDRIRMLCPILIFMHYIINYPSKCLNNASYPIIRR